MSDIICLLNTPNKKPTTVLYTDCAEKNRRMLDRGELLEYTIESMIILYSPMVGANFKLSCGSHFSQLSNTLYEVKKYYNASFLFQKSKPK